ncbi:MAG TPA: LpxD N-terminal domain-containing protein, partial [Pyrinomonadaceae bacterium]|nr:LpxD N-terminal domain-containing protein [Pyrinomonadaceae bacterium]
MKLSELARETSSIIEQGSPDLEITSAAGLDIAGPNDVSFLANPKYTPQIQETKAGAIFLNDGVGVGRSDMAVLRAKDAYVAYTLALRRFFPEPQIVPGIHPSAVIDETAVIADNV